VMGSGGAGAGAAAILQVTLVQMVVMAEVQ
jgi:hypothetical protein